jgi:hypothetical protein
LLCSLFNEPMFIISPKSGVPLNSAFGKEQPYVVGRGRGRAKATT